MFGLIPYWRRNDGLGTYNPFHHFDATEKPIYGKFHSLMEFKTDIRDSGDNYILEADLPGFKKEDIRIDIEDNYLTIKAERHSIIDEKDKKGSYIHCERTYGSYERSFDISGIKQDNISAEYSNGVLKLTLPKKELEKTNTRHLEIQ